LAGSGGSLQTLASFVDGPSVHYRPQIASNNSVVYADPSGDIVVANAVTGAAGTVSAPPAISSVSDRPGISADGNWVAFTGTLKDATASLFIASAIPSVTAGPGPSFSGPVAVIYAGAGGDPNYPNSQFNSFGIRPTAGSDGTRFGISAQPMPDGSGTNINIVFVASRSYLNSTGGVTKTVYGVYHLSTIAVGTGNQVAYTNVHIEPIVEVGNVITDASGIGRTVADFDLWDPISKNGIYAGFWVQFTDTLPPLGLPIQAVVRRHL
jgi:hypothetical protein